MQMSMTSRSPGNKWAKRCRWPVWDRVVRVRTKSRTQFVLCVCDVLGKFVCSGRLTTPVLAVSADEYDEGAEGAGEEVEGEDLEEGGEGA